MCGKAWGLRENVPFSACVEIRKYDWDSSSGQSHESESQCNEKQFKWEELDWNMAETATAELWATYLTHTHTQRTCWLVPYFVRLMFHRYSQSQLHQYKIVFSVNQGPCIEQFDCSPPQCCYAIAKPFITFLLSFHWINIAIIIIYIFMLLTINIFLLMKFFTGCPVNCTLCLKDEFLG